MPKLPSSSSPPGSGGQDPLKTQRRFRDDIVPWLKKKKDHPTENDDDDPLKWDRTATPDASRSRWPALIGLIGIAAAIVVVTAVLLHKGEDTLPAEPAPLADIFRADNRQLAWDTLEGFLQAETVEEKLAFVAWPDKVEEKIRDYYGRHADEPSTLIGFQFLSASPRFETKETYFLAISLEGDTTRLWVLLDDEDTLKIDWECLVAYSPLSIAKLITEPPADAVEMRVTIQACYYYNYEFSNPDEFQAFELHEQGDPEQTLYGYAEIGSEVQGELAELMRSGNPVPVMLLLAPPGKPGRHACKIKRLLKPHWSGE